MITGLEVGPQAVSTLLRRSIEVFSAQQATIQGPVDQKRNVQVPGCNRLGKFGFHRAVQQAEIILYCSRQGYVHRNCCPVELTKTVRGFITQSPGPQFALLNQPCERADLIFKRNHIGLLAAALVFPGSKHRTDITLRPMQFHQVDIVCLQPFKASMHRSTNRFRRQTGRCRGLWRYAIWRYPCLGTGARHLAKHNHAVARSTAHPGTNICLGQPLSFCSCRHRIHLGSIQAIHSMIPCTGKLFVRLFFRVLFTIGHGP